MAMRGTTLKPSTVTKTLVCIDGYDGVEASGRLYNPYMENTVEFYSIFAMIWSMEEFFDSISFPRSYYQDRVFIKKSKETTKAKKEVRQYMAEDVFNDERGRNATFVVQVQFRQNATWQGTITWTDEKKTQKFRSVLEMVKLMDNALTGADKEDALLGSNSDNGNNWG